MHNFLITSNENIICILKLAIDPNEIYNKYLKDDFWESILENGSFKLRQVIF